MACCHVQVAEAQGRVGAWQRLLEQQQTEVQAALSIARDHVKSSIQVCRLKLAQLQHWLSHPAAPRQQEALSRQLQEAEQRLVELRQKAFDCELEVQRVTQQQLSSPPMLSEPTQALDPATAGAAWPVTPSLKSNLALNAEDLNRQHSGNGTSSSGRSTPGGKSWRNKSVGTVSDPDQMTYHAAGQGSAGPASGAWPSRGHSLWQAAGQASSSNAANSSSSSSATIALSASAVTRRPPRYRSVTPWLLMQHNKFHCLEFPTCNN